jgi:phenylalanyl-tRNA synthetase beta chain
MIMATLEVDLKDLQCLMGKKLDVRELDDALFSYGMELDDNNGDLLFIDVTPDRPDMISKYGLARALKKYVGIEKGITLYTTQTSGIKIEVNPNVASIRPYIAAAVIKRLHIDDNVIKDLIWVQEKLHATFCRNRRIAAIGVYPCHKFTPPLNYFAERSDDISFVPLGYKAQMTGLEILDKHETGQKYCHLLEGTDRYPLLTDNSGKVLSMPPIINSEDLGRIDDSTEDIFIEVTGTNSARVHDVINILSAVFADMGGEINTVSINYEGSVDVTPCTNPSEHKLNLKDIEDLLGLKLQIEEVVSLLEKMGYGASRSGNSSIAILVPYYRVDILHKVDIIDDIARAYGISNIAPALPSIDAVGGVLKRTNLTDFLRNALIGLGFIECFTLSLTNIDYQYTKMNLGLDEAIVLSNPKSSEMSAMRTWILPELMRCVVSNESYGLPIKLFEIGCVCAKDKCSETGYKNVLRLAALITNSKTTFTDIKQVLDFISAISDKTYELTHGDHDSFISGRVGSVISYNRAICGLIGELHPMVLKNFNWNYPVSCLELDLDLFTKDLIED